MCGSHELTFDSADAPTSFTVGSQGVTGKLRGGSHIGTKGVIDERFTSESARSNRWDAAGAATHLGVQRLLGTGPWAWAGISTMAFLDRGVLVTPWGQGTWHADPEASDTVLLVFAGATHKVVAHACHKFSSSRESDGQKVDGWIQLGGGRPSCPSGGLGGLLG